MIGDYVKGLNALETLPEGIREGVLLHRKLDAFADTHPASQKAKTFFRKDYRLYAGAFVDSLYDHFIANDPQCFLSEQDLFQFTQESYAIISERLPLLPESFQKMFAYMKEQNWLYGYRNVRGMQKSFNGLVHRARYIDNADMAYEAFVSNYYTLNQYYYEFIDDIKAFAATAIDALPKK
ncbi:DUF479 domain-containing protein [Taibaiella sp. KBW10]|nr:DUF479 domain-containing protein [Taibaiella sp. KBW10]